MSDIFDKSTHNVLDDVNTKGSFAEDFEGDLFNGAESNFLGIAIGKKAKARKAAKRLDRQAAKKYKLETERIRALQGQEKQNVIKDIASGISGVAKAVFGKGGEPEQGQQVYDENYQEPGQNGGYNQNNFPQGGNNTGAPNNTLMYVGIAAVVLVGVYLLKK